MDRIDRETMMQTTCPLEMLGEADPTRRRPHEPGTKLDAGKAPVVRGALHYFPLALEAVAKVSAYGARKYAWNDWEAVPDGVTRYSDALGRHLLAEALWERDWETGLLHAAHVAWNALARLELMLREAGQEPRQ